MVDFFNENASAVFALIGALAGSLLSFFGSWLLRRRDLQLRLYEKVVDRRLASHDAVISLAKDLRKIGIAYDEAKSFDDRAPICFCSAEDLDKFNTDFALTLVANSTWLSAPLIRELHLFQEYMANIQGVIQNIGKNKTFKLGCIVREDFISFSSRIEKLALDYFSKIHQLKNIKYTDKSNYSKEEQKKRLAMTVLARKYDEILALSNKR